MPDFDMVPTVELFVELPSFDRAWGGYQPEAVDEALMEVSKQLDAERERVQVTEQRLAESRAVLETFKGPATFDHLAAAANRIVADAGRLATDIMREADMRVRELAVRTDADAAEILTQGERNAAEAMAQVARLRDEYEGRHARLLAEIEAVVGPARDAALAEAALVVQEAHEAVELLMSEVLARRDEVAMEVEELDAQRLRTTERLLLSSTELTETVTLTRQRHPEVAPEADAEPPAAPEAGSTPAAARAADADAANTEVTAADAANTEVTAAETAATKVIAAETAATEVTVADAANIEVTLSEPTAEAGEAAANAVQPAASGGQGEIGPAPKAGPGEGQQADPWATQPKRAGTGRSSGGSGRRRVRPSGVPQQGRGGQRA